MRVLSIDGGGVRGVAAAQFLACLEEHAGAPSHELFDLMVGSSAGGLIALHLAYRKEGASAAAALFSPQNAGRIMNRSLGDKLIPKILQNQPLYDGKGKSELLADVFGDTRMLDPAANVMVTAYDVGHRILRVFKSFGGEDSKGNPLVRQVADATSAAPTYFPSVAVDSLPETRLIDGGIAANNPSMVAIAECLRQGFRPQEVKLLSIGTGDTGPDSEKAMKVAKKSAGFGSIEWLNNGLLDHLMVGSSSAVDYWSGEILGERFFRVQHPVFLPASQELDNTRADNLEALREMGRLWFEDFKQSGKLDLLLGLGPNLQSRKIQEDSLEFSG